MARKPKKPIEVETLTHDEASRKNIPTAEYQSVMRDEEKNPIQLAYERRNRDLDPQLVWRGKDEQDWSDLVTQCPPLYIQEKVHPKVLIDDLLRETKERADQDPSDMPDLFADFNGLSDKDKATEFYEHDANWTNRMILGDSLSAMASLAEREGLRGKVQCIYIDPPYGIRFNSNFQWSTNSRAVKDGNAAHITREPEQVKAFRDTWQDGIHSYLTYLRDRLTVARDLLTDSGSIFVQIGDENVHRVRALMDEVFGEDNFVNIIAIKKKGSTLVTESVFDFLLWFGRDASKLKLRKPLVYRRSPEEDSKFNTLISPEKEIFRIASMTNEKIQECVDAGWKWARVDYPIVSQGAGEKRSQPYAYNGALKSCGESRQWSFEYPGGMDRLTRAGRTYSGGGSLAGIVFHEDRASVSLPNLWDDVKGAAGPIYVVQTAWKIVQRCILMTTDTGDLVLDPTCGSGTTAYVAEQWGRRWITIDTSRVALALARARIMGARYPYYLLADSPEGQEREAEVARSVPSQAPTRGDIRQGFVYERVPHITLKSIANNAEIDVIWEQRQPAVEDALGALNNALRDHPEPFEVKNGGRAGQVVDFTCPPPPPPEKATVKLPSGELAPFGALLEWEVPREAPKGEGVRWPDAACAALEDFWRARIERQKAIDASIAAKADFEYLYDKPYEDKFRIRVAGPFTVESLSPHRVLAIDEDDELIDAPDGVRERSSAGHSGSGGESNFASVMLEHLKTSGVQQAHKDDKIAFASVRGWPGDLICAEGRFMEGEDERKAGVFIGPEFGTVARVDLVAAAREAGDADFDVLIACAFNFDARSADFDKLGRVPILKARMNADLHMAEDLKNTGKGNLFVIFGEPDIEIREADGDKVQVKMNGVDVFHPQTGEIKSSGADGIACWFIDTDYNEESFFVRHAYFLGAKDPYKALKTTLKAEIDRDAWESLNSDLSRPFDRPTSGRIAVKVINHLGDEVMKVFRVKRGEIGQR